MFRVARVGLGAVLSAGLVAVPALASRQSENAASGKRYADRIMQAAAPSGAHAAGGGSVTVERREGPNTSVLVRLPGHDGARR